MAAANVALSPVRGLMTPRQLGPTMRRALPRTRSLTWRSRSAPASPLSRKPAEMMMAPLTPASMHSLTIPGTDGAGVTITARSTAPGTALIAGYALIPSTLPRLGLTGHTVPPKDGLQGLQETVRPTVTGG